MQSLNQLKKQIDTTQTIKLITQALGDIATFKLKSTRASIERNIKFYKEIVQVYRLVKVIATRKNSFKQIPKKFPGQTICVLITSNERFYGDLDTKLAEFYAKSIAKFPCKKLIVGLIGQSNLAIHYGLRGFESLTLKKDYPTPNELRFLAQTVSEYEKVLIYHTKFETILNSSPTVSDITASDVTDTVSISKIPIYYIVEPEVDKILTFFENQILLVLFQAIFLEVDITRQAARMISMIQASENTSKILKIQNRYLIEAKKRQTNLEIQEKFAALNHN